MENEVATLEGFPSSLGDAFGKIFDKRMLKELGFAAGGGAIGGAVYELALQNVGWFNTGSASWQVPAKRAGLAAALAVAGGVALSDRLPDVAKGLAGAMGAILARIGLDYMARGSQPATTQGMGEVRARESVIPFHASTGTFTGAGQKQLGGRVNVREANPAAMSAINAYGTY